MVENPGRRAGLRGLSWLAAVVALLAHLPLAHASTAWVIDSVEIRDEGGSAWRRAAFEETIRESLKGEDDPPDEATALALRGELTERSLELKIVNADGLAIATTTVEVRDTTVGALRGALAELTGSLDDALRETTAQPARIDGDINTVALGVVALVAALFIGSPLLISIVGRRRRLWTLKSAQATAAWWVALGGLAGLGAAGELSLLSNEAWVVYIAGGLFWGWFVAANGRIVFPIFHGLSRVEHRDVFRMLRVWATVAVLRLLRRAVFYAPFLALLWLAIGWISPASTLLTPVILAIVVPAWGLLARFWFLSLVENVASVLDGRLVTGEATRENVWHESVRGYVLGYVRRSAWDGGSRLFDRIMFLPGRGRDITLYGGGLTHSRIVIGTELLEFALAPYGRPHDYEAPREHKLFWSDWHAGLIVPTDDRGTPIASREMRTVEHHAEPGEIDPIHIGQAPTLAGYLEPSALDMRQTHRPAEDPTWLEWDPGNDFDGTDPGDHDFLFGALVRELGLIHRFDDQRLTLTAFFAPRAPRVPKLLRRVGRVLAAPYIALFGGAHTVLGDAYAALNGARHHLVQHLAWRLWRTEVELTARAFRPELERHSDEIFATLETEASKEPSPERKRLRWLASLSASDAESGRARWTRRLWAAAAVAAVASLVAVNVIRAIHYHPTYTERVKAAPAVTPTEDEAKAP